VADEADHWSRWILERRDAGNERQREASMCHLAGVRDRLLANAGPLNGATLLDVGTGDGLIGLEALDRVGPHGRVIFSDVSEALVEQTRIAVGSRGCGDRASFAVAAAQGLDAIVSGSVDVLTSRSVLIYVAEKPQAFSEMHRVLRPGGRISLFEPINRLMFPEPSDRFFGYDISAALDLAARVKLAFTEMEDESLAATMMGFDDRDLVDLAEDAGFQQIHLECHIDRQPGPTVQSVSLQALLDGAPNPLAPTVREVIEASLTSAEQQVFLQALGQSVAEKSCTRRSAVAYLAAEKQP
jgi:ubiquinone/menaquinone biosynthesis C-methylase UbiE